MKTLLLLSKGLVGGLLIVVSAPLLLLGASLLIAALALGYAGKAWAVPCLDRIDPNWRDSPSAGRLGAWLARKFYHPKGLKQAR